ncbi:hypothetical protein Tco_1536944, partial [Tanacetum coccineum]
VIQEGLSLGIDVRRRGARVFISFSFPVHVHMVLKPHYWTVTLVVSQTSTLITGESSRIPSSSRGRDPAYAFLLIGQVVYALGTLCPLFCWIELPLWLPSYFLLLLAFSATLSSLSFGLAH